jgi:hypothetical protein
MTILKKHQTLGTQLIEIRGEIEDNWKFNGQLKVNLHKSKINDQNGKVLKSRVNIEVW